MAHEPSGRLFVVSTPIGNLDDLSPRAAETLRAATLVLAEDTRHSRPLLERLGVTARVESYHDHNEARAAPRIVARLRRGDQVALIADAGTPLLSDPGARLVRAAVEAGVPVVPVPGPSAVLAALVASGLPCDRFTYYGFPPRRGGDRTRMLGEIAALGHTAVLYEAPLRLAGTLADLAGVAGGGRRAVVARELTKQFEEFRRGTLAELAQYYGESPPRGEVVLVLEGGQTDAVDEEGARQRARALRAGGASARDVARALVVELGVARNVAYRMAHESD